MLQKEEQTQDLQNSKNRVWSNHARFLSFTETSIETSSQGEILLGGYLRNHRYK